MKNIVFDLGGVVFSRDKNKCSSNLLAFFAFIAEKDTPRFWDEYDRGTLTQEQVLDELSAYRGCSREYSRAMLDEAIATQEAVKATEQLIVDLKAAGYKLYVLSNMAREFIDFLRRQPVYRHFDGEVVSCELLVIKPEPGIYSTLLEKYALEASQTLFIDDRQVNLDGAAKFGIATFRFNPRDPEESCAELRKQLLG